MKKIIAFALTFVLLISFGACGNTDERIKQDNLPTSNEQTSTQSTIFQTIQLNETVATDEVEITLVDKLITSTANWTSDDGTKISLEEHSDKMYFIARGTIKNLSANEINFYSGLNSEFVLDGKYKYPVDIAPNSLNSIVPLETASFAMYCEMPKNVLNECEEYQLLFGFNDGSEMATDVYSCQHGYQITGTVDEYGSAATIQNFQTFTEFVEKDIKDRGYTNFAVEAQQNDEIILIDKGNDSFWWFQLPDGTSFSASCELMLNYGIYDIFDSDSSPAEYGAISICIEQSAVSSSERTVYYSGAKSITISSSNGSIEMDKTAVPGYSYSYDSLLHTSEVTFTFWPDDYSFTELQSILSAADVTITVAIEQVSVEEPIIADIELPDEGKQALLDFLEFYKNLPLASFN